MNMRNSFNTYIQVPKGLAQEIYKMKEEQAKIPHYKAQVVELGDFTQQTKCEIFRKMKNNLMEIDKQYKNEEEKGWIGSAGYTQYSYQEKYVFPAFEYLFDLKGLSKAVNGLVEERCNEFWDKHLEGKEEQFHTKRTFPIGKFISFINESRQHILWAIRDCKEITDCQLLISFNKRDLYKWEEVEGSSIIPASVNFYIQTNEEDIDVRICKSSSAGGEHFDNMITVGSYWIQEELNNNREKLSNWKKLFIEEFGALPKEEE
jgi:hypothetical protein